MKKMKKLLFVLPVIILFLNSCDPSQKKTDTTESDVSSIEPFQLAPKTGDDLLVLLYLNITDLDYKRYVYEFSHNKTPDKKFTIQQPTITNSNGIDIAQEPNFVLLNLGKMNSLPDNNYVDYNFTITRTDKQGNSEPLDYSKNKYTYKELKMLNSKIVIQSLKINFKKDPTLPGHISPPIKPSEQPPV